MNEETNFCKQQSQAKGAEQSIVNRMNESSSIYPLLGFSETREFFESRD